MFLNELCYMENRFLLHEGRTCSCTCLTVSSVLQSAAWYWSVVSRPLLLHQSRYRLEHTPHDFCTVASRPPEDQIQTSWVRFIRIQALLCWTLTRQYVGVRQTGPYNWSHISNVCRFVVIICHIMHCRLLVHLIYSIITVWHIKCVSLCRWFSLQVCDLQLKIV